mmetsp:Transcript_44850/g.96353  ORF Transcript_44850/g.96353 Transcript_44850/m.96353 type:complete len:209 (-) Transcript_44850:235-861(-)
MKKLVMLLCSSCTSLVSASEASCNKLRRGWEPERAVKAATKRACSVLAMVSRISFDVMSGCSSKAAQWPRRTSSSDITVSFAFWKKPAKESRATLWRKFRSKGEIALGRRSFKGESAFRQHSRELTTTWAGGCLFRSNDSNCSKASSNVPVTNSTIGLFIGFAVCVSSSSSCNAENARTDSSSVGRYLEETMFVALSNILLSGRCMSC